MRLYILLVVLFLLFCVMDVASGSKNKVDTDDDYDVDNDDVEDDDDDAEEEDSSTHHSSKKYSRNKNRRIFGERLAGRVRLRGPQKAIQIARPPIFLLPPPLPAPIVINPKQTPMFNFTGPGVSVRAFGQPPVSAQAVNGGFSIANVRSAVAHNSIAATPNTFVVTPQVTSFQGTPIPALPQRISVIQLPSQNQLQISQQPPPTQIRSQFQLQPQQQIQIQQVQTPQPHVQVLTQPVPTRPSIQIPTQQSPVIMSTFSPPPPTAVGNSLDVASPPVAPPAPSPYYTSALADDIRCMRHPDTLTALLTAPPGYTASPFFNGRPDIDAQTAAQCSITLAAGSNVYRLDINDFDECGVSSQAEDDGKEWLSISVRFPLVSGLKTPEDEVITIKCRPQDRTLSANHAVDFHGNLVSPPATSRSSVFLGQERDLQCDLGLFRKAPGSSDYTHRVNAGSAIELGQELKLRAAVKPGDGWNYVRLTDVIVYRVPPSFNTNSKVQLLEASKRKLTLNQHGFEPDTTVEYAHLVLTDGCRNSAYKAIAPNHPEVDPANDLIVDFNFKAFMFQTMTEGEAVRITARVTACVEQEDCSITHCPDGFQSHGRKRRQTSSSEVDSNNNTLLANTTDFDRNLTVVVLTANNREDEWFQREYLMRNLEKERGCPELLIATVGLAVALGITLLISTCIFTYHLCKSRLRKKSQWSNHRTKSLWEEKENHEMGKTLQNQSSEVTYLDKKLPTNNMNLDLDFSNTKQHCRASLKRSDSVLRSLQTFLAASLLQSFGRNTEENSRPKLNNTETATFNTFNPKSLPLQVKPLNDDEVFIAMV